MRIFPFLPGLLLALGVWILPFAATLLPRRIRESVAQRAPWLPGLAPWIRNVGFPYAGLLLGWISSRDAGLSGQSPAEWILGLAAAVVLGILLARMSSRLSIGLGWGVVGDEARWTLYRAAVWPLAAFLPLAVVAALASSIAEFAWERRRKNEKVFDEVGLLFLTHAAGSAVLFLLAHNFFLAMLYYLTAAAVSSTDIRFRAIEMLDRVQKK